MPLWQPASDLGLDFGASPAPWQAEDKPYLEVVAHEAAIVVTEDDLLWWRIRPTPDSELDFRYGDQSMALAKERQQLVLGAHLNWDEGFGGGWTGNDLWGIGEETARRLMLGTGEAALGRYRGRVAGWVVVNEAIDAQQDDGLRRYYPWYETVDPTYIAKAFQAAHAAGPEALLVLNEFGFETDEGDDAAADKQRADRSRPIARCRRACPDLRSAGTSIGAGDRDHRSRCPGRRFAAEYRRSGQGGGGHVPALSRGSARRASRRFPHDIRFAGPVHLA